MVYIVFSILFIFIVISLFIYIETIQLKFCGLSKNTRIELLEREKLDFRKIVEDDKGKDRVTVGDYHVVI